MKTFTLSKIIKHKFVAHLMTVSVLILTLNVFAADNKAFIYSSKSLFWQQLKVRNPKQQLTAFIEREEYSNLDKTARIVFVVKTGKDLKQLDLVKVQWKLKNDNKKLIGTDTLSLKEGMGVVDFPLAQLAPGTYHLESEFFNDTTLIGEKSSAFRFVKLPLPETSGKIPLLFPNAVAIGDSSYPITCGIPFPKGVLWNKNDVRIIDSDGKHIPCQTIVRSRWGASNASSIRWLGIDFQAGSTKAWWPERKEIGYYLEYGRQINSASSKQKIVISESDAGLNVDTGRLRFLIRKTGFNLIDNVFLDGKPVLKNSPEDGLYLIDHNGGTYRASNDKNIEITVEEKGDLRTVIRISGWYVKDGTKGERTEYSLPTDRLCKFITRIEAYAGKPYIRVLSTWIITYDTSSVRLKDVGFTFSSKSKIKKAVFGVEGEKSFVEPISNEGVYLLQHLPGRFDIETCSGKNIATGKHSAGWVSAESTEGKITIVHRNTWQKFPKEMEVLPHKLKFHIWPAHGKNHPDINEVSHDNIHRIMFAHQGKELNLQMPWKYYLAAAQIADSESTGVYSSEGQVLAGVHASAMGASSTSDFLIIFSSGREKNKPAEIASCFTAFTHALAATEWACASKAVGYVHHYDPDRYKIIEDIISRTVRGYWKVGNLTNEYGMWKYRGWHHEKYLGNGKWNLYRLHNTTHHYEAYMPWLLYIRSGDPFYLTQGSANIGNLSDVGIIHYDDPKYPHKEFHFGQGRLIGSTKHTNGLSPWAADHGVAGHLTCYNAIILAYYLTGNLRYREVIEEWRNTILNDRQNTEFLRSYRPINRGNGCLSTRKEGARDVNAFLGELIDLYQLNYDPKILALIGPHIHFLINTYARQWGIPLQNALLFHSSRELKKKLLATVEDYRVKMRIPKNDPYLFWYTHTPFKILSMAAIVKPEKRYDLDAAFLASPSQHIEWAKNIFDVENNRRPYFQIPDYINFLPNMLYANAQNNDKKSWLDQFNCAQPFPYSGRNGKWSRIILQEKSDSDIILKFYCTTTVDIPIKIYDSDKQEIKNLNIPEGKHYPFVVSIPKDHKTGQYTIFIAINLSKSKLRVPLSSLPEIYYIPSGWWDQFGRSRFFVQNPSGVEDNINIYHKLTVKLRDKSNQNLLAESLVSNDLKKPFKIIIPQEGGWIDYQTTYLRIDKPLVLSVSPERSFIPDKEILDISLPPKINIK